MMTLWYRYKQETDQEKVERRMSNHRAIIKSQPAINQHLQQSSYKTQLHNAAKFQFQRWASSQGMLHISKWLFKQNMEKAKACYNNHVMQARDAAKRKFDKWAQHQAQHSVHISQHQCDNYMDKAMDDARIKYLERMQ